MRHVPRAVLVACAAALALTVLGGCQRASPFPLKKDGEGTPRGEDQAKRTPLDPAVLWEVSPAGRPFTDVPLEFVSASAEPGTWAKLSDPWNPSWGAAVSHLGLGPLGSAAAVRAAGELSAVRIKVPLGLPDPTPGIPPGNRPTYQQWRLGKKLFHDRNLLPPPAYNCVRCHNPEMGFSTERDLADEGLYNPPTLINSVYNRHQFWDGRATYLEEVLQRTLDDEAGPVGKPSGRDRPEVRHAWPGVVRSLRENPEYVREFQRVYGGPPSQATVGRALAAYLRTLLSGNSVYDRADAERARAGAKDFAAVHFESVLDKTDLKALQVGTAREAAGLLLQGHTLFHGRARCSTCHPAPLFTDHDFHNAGVGDSDFGIHTQPGQERGRAAALPAGLRQAHHLGAVRTPTLRALPRTAPYMHAENHRYPTLARVLDYFNKDIRDRAINQRLLDAALRDGPDTARILDLSSEELRALELYLKCLDGDPVPRFLTDPPAR